MMPSLTAIVPTYAPSLCPVGYAKTWRDRTQSKQLKSIQSLSFARKVPSKACICASSLNSRCAAEQTQTVKRESSNITITPIRVKEMMPKLDDGGTGTPPRDGSGGGGGGGGGGPSSSGGFFLFGFLLFLSYLKDVEEEEYKTGRR